MGQPEREWNGPNRLVAKRVLSQFTVGTMSSQNRKEVSEAVRENDFVTERCSGRYPHFSLCDVLSSDSL